MGNGLDYFTVLNTAVVSMMRTYSHEIWQIGYNIFWASAVIKMASTGWKIANHPGTLADANAMLQTTVFQILIGFTIITFYDTPDPWFGISFSDYIIDGMAAIAHILDRVGVRLVVKTLDDVLAKFIQPSGYLDFLGNILYFTIFFLVTLAKVISLIIIAFSLIAQAVLALLGPLFCSLFLVPHFNRYFYGWLDAFIQYSFLQVTAFAYILVGVNLLAALMEGVPKGLTSDLYTTFGVDVFVYVLAYIVGFLFIPGLNASMFSGFASTQSVNVMQATARLRALRPATA